MAATEVPCSNLPLGDSSAENTANWQHPSSAPLGPLWQSCQVTHLQAVQKGTISQAIPTFWWNPHLGSSGPAAPYWPVGTLRTFPRSEALLPNCPFLFFSLTSVGSVLRDEGPLHLHLFITNVSTNKSLACLLWSWHLLFRGPALTPRRMKIFSRKNSVRKQEMMWLSWPKNKTSVGVSSRNSECSMSLFIWIPPQPSTLDSYLGSEAIEYDTKTDIKFCDTLRGSPPDYDPIGVSHSPRLWHWA